MLRLFYFLLFLLPTSLIADLQILNPSAKAIVPNGGPIIGLIVRTSRGTVGSMYLGIPYAEPPTGQLRFRPSLPARNWTQPMQCQEYAPACPQNQSFIGFPQTAKSEDCLYLNVFTGPNCNKQNLCPVIYYVHGGMLQYRCLGVSNRLQRSITGINNNYYSIYFSFVLVFHLLNVFK